MASKVLLVLLVPLVISLDRLSKLVVTLRFKEGEGFWVLSPVLSITRVNNRGAAFGFLRHNPFVVVAVSVLFIVGILFYFVKSWVRGHSGRGVLRPAKLVSYGWAFVLAGAASNLYDRIHYGYVVDFLDLRVWPVFNVADMSICLGVCLVVLHFFVGGKG